MYAMQVRSPSGTSSPMTGSTDFPTGRLSPVSAASSISSVAARVTRPSAGIRLPASTSTTSPGTSSWASISTAWPSRRTRAIVFIIWASALTLSSALDSWRSPITALNTVSPASSTVVPVSCVTIWLTTAATRRMTCMKSWYWRRKAFTPDSLAVSERRLAPIDSSRALASSADRPVSGTTPNACATWAASALTGSIAGLAAPGTARCVVISDSPVVYVGRCRAVPSIERRRRQGGAPHPERSSFRRRSRRKRTGPPTVWSGALIAVCARGDLNPHALSDTAT